MRFSRVTALALTACSPAASGPRAPSPAHAISSRTSTPTTTSIPTTTTTSTATVAVTATSDSSPRIFSIREKTWIWPRPRVPTLKPGAAPASRFLGYVRVGQSVRLRNETVIAGENCRRGFYPIEPRGFVCDDDTITRDPDHPFLRDNAATLPVAGPAPYRYAISSGAPMYARVPSDAEQKSSEWRYGAAGTSTPLGYFQRGHEQLAVSDPIAASDEAPDFVSRGPHGFTPLEPFVRTIPRGSMFSFTRAFESGGRTWLLSTDLTVVPADRVRAFRGSSFTGVPLGGAVELPIAWFRAQPRTQYRKNDDGSFSETGAQWPEKSWAPLTGRALEHGGHRFLETTSGAFADAADATVVERRAERPFLIQPGEKWIIVSIRGGTLVAYDDLTPVFTTLISPGIGGVPRAGGDLVKDSTTPLGNYRITFKDRATTMSPQSSGSDPNDENRFWIADVPFTQYFAAPFALHGSYWHDKLGEPMSAGCVNASLRDAAWLFDWSDPRVPDGWQGASGAGNPENGGASWVVVTR